MLDLAGLGSVPTPRIGNHEAVAIRMQDLPFADLFLNEPLADHGELRACINVSVRQ